jgi:23S rRNA C2498 (ribose-2'-O)-methylase RlmM
MERIRAEERMRRAEIKHEREIREAQERFIVDQSARYREAQERELETYKRTTDEHLERLNNADKTAEKVADVTKEAADAAKRDSVSKELYEADRKSDAERRDLLVEQGRLTASNLAAKDSLRRGQIEGRDQLVGLSRNVVLFILAVAGGIIVILRFWLAL